jgi:hypothetical protein
MPIQFAGVIRFKAPLVGGGLSGECDDSTLAGLLRCFAHRASLAESRENGLPRLSLSTSSLPTSQRFSWPWGANAHLAISANLDRLLADLHSEFDQRSLAP